MPKVIDIYNYIDEIAPFSEQEEWDNSGFLIGESDREVFKVILALDVTSSLFEQATDAGCQLIVTHHPVIFKAARRLTDNSLIYKAAKSGISVISAHTSYDCADSGVSQILAETLGLQNIQKSSKGEFRLGNCRESTVLELARSAENIFHSDVAYCNADKKIKTVAVCGGAGSDFISEASAAGADVFLTGEASHHDFLDAYENNIGLITAGHFETEIISIRPLLEKLSRKFTDVEFIQAKEKSPIYHI